MLSNQSFGQALYAAKLGKRISREGWNGKNMFVFQRPEDKLSLKTVVQQVKSLPQSVKDFLHVNCKNENGDAIPLEDGKPVKFGAYLCMYAADGSIVNGWLASQTDMLATDWCILD
ncbi:DUF2829 domain-containing protein [Flectobacillus sp. BAB-3569]|uniref:DUF2829 domain-containing protein n=1 Tax=Flectobacillus sp. BAB-3569 TaxID=1509483 RepID=UPI000BA2C18C|nr:DUF2829 domain-containing protein [Flectobacillus sp. BAB-3569]PAC27812.1 hypothetical protein BWI92_21610 [Flectobacillus sp. BAB-3569]